MLRTIALLLTLLTGFSGLVYEVAWHGYLATLLGSDGRATATILGIFLGGLAVGYSVFARVTRRVAQRGEAAASGATLLRLYGVVEVAIGVHALLFPWLFALVHAASSRLPVAGGLAGAGLDVLLTVVLIGPPTVLMGGTIPMLTQGLAGSVTSAARVHALIYGCNTLGAFLGAAAAGFVLVPWLGLVLVVRVMGVVNLVAGGVFLLLGRRGSTGVAPSPGAEPAPGPTGVRHFAAYALAALLSGYAMMAVQVVLIRLGGLSFGSSRFTFSMVVATFVLCIALGSFAVSVFRDVRRGAVLAVPWLLVAMLLLLYGHLQDGPYWAHRLRALFGREDADFLPFQVSTFAAIVTLLALPIGLSGALLPMLFGLLRQRLGDLGDVAGRLYSWNTVGSLLGALIGGYALLLWLDLHHVYRSALLALTATAVVLGFALLPRRGALVGLVVAAGVAGVIGTLEPWDPLRLSYGLFRARATNSETAQGPGHLAKGAHDNYAIRFYADDPAASVAVWERRGVEPLARSIRTNGKSEGEIPSDYTPMSMVVALAALVADDCADAFVIGYGTGVTVGELAALECSRRVEVAEISPAVLAAAPLFDYGNQQASRSPKVVPILADAYRALARDARRYDVIVSEPSNPWVAGVEMLFSRDFLELARRQLKPGGVFGQWIHHYETDAATLARVLRTYAAVFDDVAIWYMSPGDVALLGLNGSRRALDVAALEARFDRADFRAAFERAGIPTFARLLAREVDPLGVLGAAAPSGPVHTLLHPRLGDLAARAFFRGDRASLPVYVQPAPARAGRENSLVRRWVAAHGGRADDDWWEDVVAETCEFNVLACATLLADWHVRSPDAPGLAARLERHLKLTTSPGNRAVFDVLVRLLRGDDGSAAPTTAKEAMDASKLFVTYYHHAAPFDRAALWSLWRRCAGGAECAAGLAQVEQAVGSLRPGA
jgi:predicted membrane-bound spermidine synthase